MLISLHDVCECFHSTVAEWFKQRLCILPQSIYCQSCGRNTSQACDWIAKLKYQELKEAPAPRWDAATAKMPFVSS